MNTGENWGITVAKRLGQDQRALTKDKTGEKMWQPCKSLVLTFDGAISVLPISHEVI